MDFLFGGNKGPSKGELALQAERNRTATKADAEADQKMALATRAASLKGALSYKDDRKKQALGG